MLTDKKYWFDDLDKLLILVYKSKNNMEIP